MDATDLAALSHQLRQLTAVLDRLARVREESVPAAATFWSGSARRAYDRAVAEVDDQIGSTLELLRLAQQNTVLALREELQHA
ncbi:hypothetical protein BH09ACT5_BH09ACT5_11560 [soil metagenome]